MVTKVRRWGNSLGLRLPKSAAADALVRDGSSVDVTVAGGKIIIEPVKHQPLSLKHLLAEVRPSNLHSEADFGGAAGRELL